MTDRADETPETPTERLRRALGYTAQSTRTYHVLLRNDITSLADLDKCTYSDLLALRNFGDGSLDLVIGALAWDRYDRQVNDPAK